MKSLHINRTANANLQYKINLSVIFNYLREHSPTYRAKISRDLKISAPAVSRVVDRLLEDGYVIETIKIKTASGKHPTEITLNAQRGYVVGIDLVKEKIRLALTDFSGKVLATQQGFEIENDVPLVKKLGENITDLLGQYIKEHKKNAPVELIAIGVGVPATVDIVTGAIIHAPLFESLNELNLKAELEKLFSVPVYVENISKLSALGEKQYGLGKNYRNVLFLEVSRGIGAGIIIDNNLIRGTSGAAGEIGFMIVHPEGLMYKKERKGYLELNAAIDTICKKAIDAIIRGKKTNLMNYVDNNLHNLNSRIVCEAYFDGDPVAVKIIREMVELLAIATINLVLTLNPQIVIIGGDVCRLPQAEEIIVKPLREYVSAIVPFPVPEVAISRLGEDAGIIGACYLATESLIVGEFPYYIEDKRYKLHFQ